MKQPFLPRMLSTAPGQIPLHVQVNVAMSLPVDDDLHAGRFPQGIAVGTGSMGEKTLCKSIIPS